MTTTGKTWTAIIVVIVLVIIGWLIWGNKGSNSPSTGAPANGVSTNAGESPNAGLTTAPADSSNAALQTDLNSIDSQMSGLNNDSANVDQSVGNSSAGMTQ